LVGVPEAFLLTNAHILMFWTKISKTADRTGVCCGAY